MGIFDRFRKPKPAAQPAEALPAMASIESQFPQIGGIEIVSIEEKSNGPKKWIAIFAAPHEEQGKKLDCRTVFQLISAALLSRGYETEGQFRRSHHFDIPTTEFPNLTVDVIKSVVQDLSQQYPDAASLQRYRESEARRMEQAMRDAEKRQK